MPVKRKEYSRLGSSVGMVAVKDDGHRDGDTSWLTMYLRTGILLKRFWNGLVSKKKRNPSHLDSDIYSLPTLCSGSKLDRLQQTEYSLKVHFSEPFFT